MYIEMTSRIMQPVSLENPIFIADQLIMCNLVVSEKTESGFKSVSQRLRRQVS